MSYYAVRIGKKSGIYRTWAECSAQVTGFSGAVFKKFKTHEEAEYFISGTSIINNNIDLKSSDTIIQSLNISVDNNKITENDEYLVVYTDGSCKNNGYNKEIGGIGVFFGDNDSRNVSQKIEGNITNNRAEMMAVIKALEICYQDNIKKVEIRSDSNYIVRAMNEWISAWKQRRWLNVKNYDLWIQIDNLNSAMDIRWVHVRGHQNCYGNNMGDALANACL